MRFGVPPRPRESVPPHAHTDNGTPATPKISLARYLIAPGGGHPRGWSSAFSFSSSNSQILRRKVLSTRPRLGLAGTPLHEVEHPSTDMVFGARRQQRHALGYVYTWAHEERTHDDRTRPNLPTPESHPCPHGARICAGRTCT